MLCRIFVQVCGLRAKVLRMQALEALGEARDRAALPVKMPPKTTRMATCGYFCYRL